MIAELGVYLLRILKALTRGWAFWVPALSLLIMIKEIFERIIIPTIATLLSTYNQIEDGLSDLPESDFLLIDGIAYANAVLPVEEAVTLIIGYFTWIMLILTFRWIKQFIPTLSS